MAVIQTGQFSFVDALLPHGIGRNGRLDRLEGLVKWYRFEKVLCKLREQGSAGRPAYGPLLMFKALLLQSLYGLSDADLEHALADRLSFRRFVGLSLEDHVPDHSTLCRFRNVLVKAGMLETLFAELDRQLDQAGLILRRGTMLDATIIETHAARPRGNKMGGDGLSGNGVNKDGQPAASDPDARFTRRSGKPGSAYGYKAHVGVDEGSGLIRTFVATPANVNDTVVADALICGDEKQVMADAAYHTHARQRALQARGIKPRLMRRPNKYHPKLSPRLKRYNQLISKRRAAVETTFATLKRRSNSIFMGLSFIRYRGLAKAAGQIALAAIAFNMRHRVTLAP